MKTFVILNASPRPNSNISQMLNLMRNELLANGNIVNYVDVCKLQFHPCIGCMKCRSTHDCIMPEDDAKQILRLVQQSDGIIVASHCYDGSQQPRSPSSAFERQEGSACHDMLYTLAVQLAFQAIARNSTRTKRSPMLERF